MKKQQKQKTSFLVKIFFGIMVIACVVPLILILSISLSESEQLVVGGYSFLPQKISFDAYKYLLKNGNRVLNAYKITVIVTVIGSFFGLIFTAQLAYALSRKEYKLRNKMSLLVFFTMMFNGGLIPTYILMANYLGMKDNILALILPSLISPWNVMLLRSFFSDIPSELIEAAYIDGADELRIFYGIILPISKPALATVGTFLILSYWNDWFQGLLYITKQELEPLQYMLYKMSENIEELQSQMSYFGSNVEYFPKEPIRMAMAIIAAGPIVFIFLLTQRYFIKGITLGAVKG